jgi:hypothetical protein
MLPHFQVILQHRCISCVALRGVQLFVIALVALFVSLSGCSTKHSTPQANESQASVPKADLSSDLNNESLAKSSAGNIVHRLPTEVPDPKEPTPRESDDVRPSEVKDVNRVSNEVATSSSQPSPPEPGHQKSKRKSIPDIESTTKKVRDLTVKARQAKDRKDYGNAFHLTTQAWEATRLHPGDARLRSLGEELFTELGTLGDLANSKFATRVKDDTTTLIDK